ncbi:MAG TPA: hypothetical protein VJB57_19440 [Dehalococcoidia bacterium]|nr:hypothetical protein [Dehalococcoidia bacterium]
MARLDEIASSISIRGAGLSTGDVRYLRLRKAVVTRHLDAGELQALIEARFPGRIYHNPLDAAGELLDPANARVDGVSVTPQEIVIALATNLSVANRRAVRLALEGALT